MASASTSGFHSIDVDNIGLPSSRASSRAILLSGILTPTVLRPLNILGSDVEAGSMKVNAPGRLSRSILNALLSMRAYSDDWERSLHTIDRNCFCGLMPFSEQMRSMALLLSALHPMAYNVSVGYIINFPARKASTASSMKRSFMLSGYIRRLFTDFEEYNVVVYSVSLQI